jgi:hypothetical protein
VPLKLLDYGRPNPFGETIGGLRRLAWPVNTYRVTLPKASNDANVINPFERVILKLLNAVGAMNADALVDETFIPPDLVKIILLRLQDKGIINEQNAIIKRKPDNEEIGKEKTPAFVTALLFRELDSGKILPFLHFVDDGNPLRKREEEKFIKIVRANQAHTQSKPVPRDVINALRAMKKRAIVFGNDAALPLVEQITIVPQPELDYLDCPIAIQKSDGEFRIGDPFGNGFSLILERAFERLLEHDDKLAEWLNKWKASLRNPRPPKADGPDKRPREPFDNEANRQRYPKLVAVMRPSQRTPYRPLFKIHASLEWALFYACCGRPFEEAITALKFTPQLEHSALLGNAAQSVGLELPEFGFRPIPEGRLLDFQNGKAEQGTLLAIAILQAQKDRSHPLRRIASSHPDLLNRLLALKRKRDEKGHGTGRIDAPETELPGDSFMREIVHSLLPNICFADTIAVALDEDTRADSLLDARASIQSEFGFAVFNRLGANLQDRLIHAERFWLSCEDGDDALVFAFDLYAAIQSAFGRVLVGKLPPDIGDSEFIKTAEMKAADARLINKALPKCLRNVKLSAIGQTLQGAGQTLGSCVVAFLLMSDSEALLAMAGSQPSFIDDIENIITRRGHGNEPLPLLKTEIGKLRKAAYSTIKTLLEI